MKCRTTPLNPSLMVRMPAVNGSEFPVLRQRTSGSQFTETAPGNLSAKTKRPPGNLGSLFFQGRIVPTEVSSIETFCGNLMSLKSTVSSKICDLNGLIFNNLHCMSKSQQTGPKWAKSAFP